MSGGTGPGDEVVLLFSTAPAAAAAGKPSAHELAQQLLRERLCACVNVVPAVVSHYWWQGAIERAEECLLVLKTTRDLAAKLQDRLVALHPYDVPEALIVPVEGGHAAYLRWVADSVRLGTEPPAVGS